MLRAKLINKKMKRKDPRPWIHIANGQALLLCLALKTFETPVRTEGVCPGFFSEEFLRKLPPRFEALCLFVFSLAGPPVEEKKACLQ